MGAHDLIFEVGPLSERSQKVAETELGETADAKVKALKALRELLKEEEKNGLVLPFDNDNYLIRFLRKKMYSPEEAFESVTMSFHLNWS